jgi:hypothetical protein
MPVEPIEITHSPWTERHSDAPPLPPDIRECCLRFGLHAAVRDGRATVALLSAYRLPALHMLRFSSPGSAIHVVAVDPVLGLARGANPADPHSGVDVDPDPDPERAGDLVSFNGYLNLDLVEHLALPRDGSRWQVLLWLDELVSSTDLLICPDDRSPEEQAAAREEWEQTQPELSLPPSRLARFAPDPDEPSDPDQQPDSDQPELEPWVCEAPLLTPRARLTLEVVPAEEARSRWDLVLHVRAVCPPLPAEEGPVSRVIQVLVLGQVSRSMLHHRVPLPERVAPGEEVEVQVRLEQVVARFSSPAERRFVLVLLGSDRSQPLLVEPLPE